MWIESLREAHAGGEFRDERVAELNDGESVSFNESGTAQVPAEVGNYLVDAYDVFVTTDDQGDTDADDAADDDGDESDTTEEDES